MSGDENWALEVAEHARDGINDGMYGGAAPNSSTALSETWPTRAGGAAMTIKWDGKEWAIVVAKAADLPDAVRAPHFG